MRGNDGVEFSQIVFANGRMETSSSPGDTEDRDRWKASCQKGSSWLCRRFQARFEQPCVLRRNSLACLRECERRRLEVKRQGRASERASERARERERERERQSSVAIEQSTQVFNFPGNLFFLTFLCFSSLTCWAQRKIKKKKKRQQAVHDSHPNHETPSTDIASDENAPNFHLSFQIWEFCLRVSLSVFCSVHNEEKQNALDAGHQTLESLFSGSARQQHTTDTRSPGAARRASDGSGSTGKFSLDEPRYFVKNQHYIFLFVFFLVKDSATLGVME